ncbi:phospholipase B-like protein, putative [Bodo saltans]|uniref:Phospholipase B-like n=1 Tax=Bodo saltans TaxID=75058 RepID=A0A0S4JH75_BODSA|nr:phospholipase B-like protein, putative [Bodo saltans]|eukprot:CUG89471.1 phospholipase B-like protein, putative [Bodo saltans]
MIKLLGACVLSTLVLCASAKLYYVVPSPTSPNGYLVLEDLNGVPMETVAAEVNYTNSLMEIGWDIINVTTNARISDWDQAYAAGYGEGAVTWQSAWDNYQNNQFTPGQPAMPANITTWVHENWKWMQGEVAAKNSTSTLMQGEVAAKNSTSTLWYHVGLTMRQFDGLLDGLNSAAPNTTAQFTFDMLQSINLAGDLLDLYNALNISMMASTWRSMPKKEFQNWFGRSTHCSALVKLKYDFSEIFIGHATWSTYNMMVRSYKTYTLNYQGVAAKTVSFSGYGGVLVSIDDFYTASSGLVITETSFTILNMSLYSACQPQQLFYWIRVTVANRVASNGQEWADLFSQHNSGTYNNQWIVLDTNRFTPFQDLQSGTLTIVEQIPGLMGTVDATNTLSYGYWPSYNIPSIPELYVLSGNAEAVILQGWEMNDYERAVRAQIFRRDQTKVTDLASMQYILQYNDFEHDPISEDLAIFAIASRGDLLPPSEAECWGAIDAKVTSTTLMKYGQSVSAYSGPTPQQGAFNMATTNATSMCTPVFGQPLLWNFSFVNMTV